MRWLPDMLKSLALLAALGLFALGALLAALLLEHRTEIALPMPTGPFAVGRAIDAWTDDVADPLAPVQGTKRELLVWIWYPSATAQSTTTEEYLPPSLRTAIESARGPVISKLLTRDLSKVHTHSIRNGDVSPQERSFPVVIMRAGGSAEIANYSTLAEDLASHGYVVVGFDAPYRTNVVVFPDGRTARRRPENNPELCLSRSGQERARCVSRVLGAWTADVAFALDRLKQLNMSDPSGKFTGRLDMTRVGIFGHSFGGTTALQFCREDSRCKAGIDVDGAPEGSVIETGVRQPFMFLLSDHSRENDQDSRRIKANIKSIYDRVPPDGRLLLAIRGANHFLFSDDGALLKSHIVLGALHTLGIVGIDGRRQLAVTAYCLHSFFDAYLKGGTDARPRISSQLYPEIQFLAPL